MLYFVMWILMMIDTWVVHIGAIDCVRLRGLSFFSRVRGCGFVIVGLICGWQV